jgi:methionine synthase II (cobalamin-independent)
MNEYNAEEVKNAMIELHTTISKYKSFTYDDTDIDMIICHTEMKSIIFDLSKASIKIISLINNDAPSYLVMKSISNMMVLNDTLNKVTEKMFNIS